MSNINIGNAFPLEKLDSDISRNNYNYQSILNGLIKWNNSSDDTVTIRLTKDSAPWFEDYIIPSKKSTLNVDTFKCDITGAISANSFVIDTPINCVVYGGKKKFKTTSFSASGYTVTPSTIISVNDSIDFVIGDPVKFTTDSGTIPTNINSHVLYYIISKTGNNIEVSTTKTGSAILLNNGSGVITVSKFESNPDSDDSDKGDIVTFRTTVTSSGSTEWGLYYAPSVYAFISGTEYRAGNYVIDNGILYRTIFNTTSTDDISYTNLFRPLISTWTYGTDYYAGDLVIDPLNSKVYMCVVDMLASILNPSNQPDVFEFYSNVWVSGTDYVKGSYVYYNGQFYICTNDIISSMVIPPVDIFNWDSKMLFRVNSIAEIHGSTLGRWYATCDATQFYVRNATSLTSTESTDIHIQISIKTVEPKSIYQRNVGIFPTSNYNMWPDNQDSVWASSAAYGPTDTSIPISNRQVYSASMIFDHTRIDKAKTLNYVNYDGPDLDQGLCIYLPVEVEVGDDGIAYPEDGFTYEFFFRIWPNAQLNGSITRDHTVNKSQIYVYSVANRDSIMDDKCETPIAKFSMARTTNFYMFGENVSIPDKPVCYRATFTYSSVEKRWMVTDYYQLPDHIFVGPVGFIDPQTPSNADVYMDSLNINPNASFIGYETAAFPMFQDPFSSTNLSPYRFTNVDDINAFINRML